ncbi:universal stress protein [Brachybacterium sp. MASK1Z-5]|uniref:Universal stress protein n=1 Tax=Brachybacterium halotolerans TaxID=2795215 RepID=A0ABS1BCH4_9MICO|nr:universal stress protein [Brachybacterium halotolerans]MBK0332345.1 universal stress protein [Brachybacterium halotolerans]
MKILLGYVPSPTSEAALEYALEEARTKDATLVVLASERSDDPRKNAGDAGREPLHERLEASGVHFELRVVPRRDDAADDILQTIDNEKIDQVVLGVRRRTPIGKMLLGSTAQRVIMEAPCPVVCVKPKTRGR